MGNPQFDLIAAEYDASLPAHVVEHYLRKRTRFLLDRCSSGHALDVGCGTGALADRLARNGLRTTGVDPSAGMLQVLRERNPRVEALEASGTALPFPDSSFDLVLCVAVMHHVAEAGAVRGVLGEMVRVARPSGHVVVWDHNPRNPYWRILMARVPQDTGEERLIAEAELIGGLSAAGADVTSSDQLGLVPDFTPPVLLPAAARMESFIEGTPVLKRLCAHNVVVAVKR